jgi:chromosome partitioning protein
MSVIALYNLKGGVGKTTAAVNLSHLAAAGGYRTLLWDLDPQGAASFAFRIRPRVAGFGKKTLASADALRAAIRATDYERLDLLPADFAYRKLDRILSTFSKPDRVLSRAVESLANDYDVVFLDCPPGFSLVTEAVFAAANLVLVPTIPTVLSMRALARLIKWGNRDDHRARLSAFLSMVDGRKRLHRQTSDWARRQANVILTTHIPYASIVEQMTVRRMPLSAFAAADPAARAFRAVWQEVQAQLDVNGRLTEHVADRSRAVLQGIETLIAALESGSALEMTASPSDDENGDSQPDDRVDFIHQFDTDAGALRKAGWLLELRERSGTFALTVSQTTNGTNGASIRAPVHVQVDGRWATQILSGVLSPLGAIERRLGEPAPFLVRELRTVVANRPIRRVTSRHTVNAQSVSPEAAPPAMLPTEQISPSEQAASPDDARSTSPVLVKGHRSAARMSAARA